MPHLRRRDGYSRAWSDVSRLHTRKGALRGRYRMREVPPTEGLWRLDLRCQYTIKPDNVEMSSWSWRVWLEFLSEWEGKRSWRPSLIGYEGGWSSTHPAPNTVRGSTRTREEADQIVRAVIADVQERRAANEALAMAQQTHGTTDQVPT